MLADRDELIDRLSVCLTRLTGASIDLRAVPEACALVDLEQHGLSLDSLQLLELVVLLEDDLGCELDLAEVADDWLTYTWGRFLEDLGAARR